MARVKGAMMTRKRRNKTLKMAKGYWGSKSKHFRVANQAVMKSLSYAYTGRRLKKRDFRSLWITRISAACKLNGMNYSSCVHPADRDRKEGLSGFPYRGFSRPRTSVRGLFAAEAKKTKTDGLPEQESPPVFFTPQAPGRSRDRSPLRGSEHRSR